MPDHPPVSRASRLIAAKPEALYAALMDPAALAEWMPPGDMTGQIHSFTPGIGGGFEMSLYYPEGETHPGKSAANEDRTTVRFLALDPPHSIAWGVTFETDDPALQGEMRMTWTFEPADDGTHVTVLTENLPPGLKPEDNDEGSRLSLEQLAQWISIS